MHAYDWFVSSESWLFALNFWWAAGVQAQARDGGVYQQPAT